MTPGRRTGLVAVLLISLLFAVTPGCGDGGAPAPAEQASAGSAAGAVTPSGASEPVGGTETIGGTEVPEGTAVPEEGFEVLDAAPELTRAEERGLMIFRHYCAHCHGDSGAGDGQNSFGLAVAPRNLRAAELDGRTDAELHGVIADGGAAHGLANLMPPWGQVLEPKRIDDLVGLIRVLPDVPGPEDEYGDVPSLDGDGDMGDFSL